MKYRRKYQEILREGLSEYLLSTQMGTQFGTCLWGHDVSWRLLTAMLRQRRHLEYVIVHIGVFDLLFVNCSYS